MARQHHTRHNERCKGYGHVFGSEEIASFLRTTLKHHDFLTSSIPVGAIEMVKYGSKHCDECKKWLRR